MSPRLNSVVQQGTACVFLAGVCLCAQTRPACDAEALVQEGNQWISKQHYAESERAYRRAANCASDSHRAIRAWNNAGAANLLMLRYAPALECFVHARDAARNCGEREFQAVAALNVASVYTLLGAGDAAEESLHEAVSALPAESPYAAKLYAQRVSLALRRGNPEQALGLWDEAMAVAQRSVDRSAERHLWDDLSLLCSAGRNTACAEMALNNEFRIVTLYRLPHRDHLYMRVGRLRMEQGRAEEALEWFERAARQRRAAPSPVPPWMIEQDKAQALAALNRQDETLATLRRAWRLALAWRQDVLPSDSAEVAADVSLWTLAEDFAGAAVRAAAERNDQGLMLEAWAAVEQGRAVSLRHLLASRQGIRERLGGEYARLLADWRAEVAANLDRRPSRKRAALTARLTEMELRAGGGELEDLSDLPPDALLRRVQVSLKPEQAVLSFLLSEPHSYVWSLTAKGLHASALPGRTELNQSLEEFRQAVHTNAPDARKLGADLYRTMFGGLGREAQGSSEWLISADQALLRAPLAALCETAGSRYLVEQRALLLVPTAVWLSHPPSGIQRAGLLAVGDAIHNRADGRFVRRTTSSRGLLSFWILPTLMPDPQPEPSFELPRLVGSGGEVRRISAQWRQAGAEVRELTGPAASGRAVEEALRQPVAAVHFATHVVQLQRGDNQFLLRQHTGNGPGFLAVPRPDDAFLALSLRADGVHDGINTDLVSTFQVPGSLVVLSGCNSGLGTIQPGAGLMGLTRAWLAAGARSVVASLWPVTDDSGVLFSSFYQAILTGEAPAVSLREAQLAMLRNGGWRAEPRYWATYFAIGKE